MTKTFDTLIEDIYAHLAAEERGGLTDEEVDALAAEIAQVLKNRAEERRRDSFTLRMSNYGYAPRRLWFDSHRPRQKHRGNTLLKFLIGDLYEATILYLAKAAGHSVTHEQEEVELEGIKGHTDAVIDGVVADVKSASSWSFKKKFKEAAIFDGDDAFAYIPQLLGYRESLGNKKAGFVVANKETGDLLALPVPDALVENVDVSAIAEVAKQAVQAPSPPQQKCYPDEADGVAGNRILSKNCSFCPHKMECWAETNNGVGLRVFQYAKGPAFFTKIVKTPNVEEVTDLWNGAEAVAEED